MKNNDGNAAINSPINEEGDTFLHLAATMEGQSKTVIFLIKHGADVNIQNARGETPLFKAAREGQKEAVKVLLAKGADINRANEGGKTPINVAVLYRNRPIVELLVKGGANLNPEGHPLVTSQFIRDDRKLAEYFIEKGADVNHVDENGNTLLHEAVKNKDNQEFVAFLIEHGADVNQTNDQGQPPLELAIQNENSVAARFLLDNDANPNVEGRFLFHQAVMANKPPMILSLIKYGADMNLPNAKGLTPFHLAIHEGHFSILDWMLDDWHLQFPISIPLNLNPETGPSYIVSAFRNGNEELAEKLCNRGADINKPIMGITPLHEALKARNTPEVKFLLENGATFSKKEVFSFLQEAFLNGDIEIAKLLIDKGATFSKKEGFFFLQEALISGNIEIAKLLVANGVNINRLVAI